jgi:N-acetylglucosamine-6-phosphate deacetylase
MTSIVPDGFMLIFLRYACEKNMKERLFVITDAVTETNAGPYHHHLTGDKYETAGILSGSALTMAKSLRNLVNMWVLKLDEALRMVSLYPAQVMKKIG